MFKRVLLQVSVGIAFGAASLTAHAADITGAGASFPYPIYAKWAAKYHEETGNRVNYQSIGSGGGQQQIIAKTVDFGASDDPKIGRASCRERVCQVRVDLGGRRSIKKTNTHSISSTYIYLTR